MPRILTKIHEYYENRIVWGFQFSVVDDPNVPGKKRLKVGEGLGVVSREPVEVLAPVYFPASDFIVDGNKQRRTDIIVLDNTGEIYVVKGVPGVDKSPDVPELSLQLAHVTINAGWKNFVGSGATDEVICLRSQYIIDTRFEPIV